MKCSSILGPFARYEKNHSELQLFAREQERETDRQIDRQREREKQRESEREREK
jgi:hypothetical protein